jgi:hypothetical protein
LWHPHRIKFHFILRDIQIIHLYDTIRKGDATGGENFGANGDLVHAAQ